MLNPVQMKALYKLIIGPIYNKASFSWVGCNWNYKFGLSPINLKGWTTERFIQELEEEKERGKRGHAVPITAQEAFDLLYTLDFKENKESIKSYLAKVEDAAERAEATAKESLKYFVDEQNFVKATARAENLIGIEAQVPRTGSKFVWLHFVNAMKDLVDALTSGWEPKIVFAGRVYGDFFEGPKRKSLEALTKFSHEEELQVFITFEEFLNLQYYHNKVKDNCVNCIGRSDVGNWFYIHRASDKIRYRPLEEVDHKNKVITLETQEEEF